jgi:hypothetical protein
MTLWAGVSSPRAAGCRCRQVTMGCPKGVFRGCAPEGAALKSALELLYAATTLLGQPFGGNMGCESDVNLPYRIKSIIERMCWYTI